VNLWAVLSEGLGFGKAVAEALDMPDDVDDARAIRHLGAQLGTTLRQLEKAGLSRGARVALEGRAFGLRMALVRLGVPEGEIPKAQTPAPAVGAKMGS